MAAYVQQIASDNTGEHSRLKRNLIRAIKEELTDRKTCRICEQRGNP
jgi:hypothetical protein